MQTKTIRHPEHEPLFRLAERTRRYHEDLYGVPPAILAYAPGRIEVLGNHTDYNEGLVLACAIDSGICAALSPISAPEVRLSAPARKESWRIPVREAFVPEKPDASAYVGGVLHLLLADAPSASGGACMTIDGNLPVGAGLSSSAALEMAAALALAHRFDLRIDAVSLARIGQRAESEYAGVRCGLMDQMTSLMAQRNTLLCIDFRSLHARPVPMPDSAVFLVCNTGVHHRLAESAYNERRHRCEAAVRELAAWSGRPLHALRDVDSALLARWAPHADAVTVKRAAHVVGEIERVRDGSAALESGDLDRFGRLMFASHDSSVRQFENSCPELDAVVKAASQTRGVLGARLSGGGFGGSAILLACSADAERAAEAVGRRFRTEFGRTPEIRIAHPSRGAHLLHRAPDGLLHETEPDPQGQRKEWRQKRPVE